jgi:glycosyltransferase involved in cell wall biosynthesis
VVNVSVVIPTYNRYELLQRALRSVAAQTYFPFEIIVVDDGSTDATSHIQEEFDCIIYDYQENVGVAAARNRGIALSKGEWIAFLDSDDEWHPTKLAKQVALHSARQNLLFSYTDEQWVRNKKVVTLPKKYKKYEGMIFEHCLSHCIIAPSAALLHKRVLEDVGVFDETLEVCEDYDLWLRITCKYEAGLINEPLITKYGGHDDQLSFRHWGMDRFRVRSLEKLFGKNIEQKTVAETLYEKYKRLLAGAKKYNRAEDIKEYRVRMDDLTAFLSTYSLQSQTEE